MIRDAIVLQVRTTTGPKFKIVESFSILNRMSSSLKSESSGGEHVEICHYSSEKQCSKRKNDGIPRFVPFETFRELCVNDKEDEITIKLGETKSNTLEM